MGVRSPGKWPKFRIKEMKVTTYLKCKGGRDESNLFCISSLFKANQPTWQGFSLLGFFLFVYVGFFIFFIQSELNSIFV